MNVIKPGNKNILKEMVSLSTIKEGFVLESGNSTTVRVEWESIGVDEYWLFIVYR